MSEPLPSFDDPPRVLSMPDLSGPNLSADVVADAVEFVLRTGLPAQLVSVGLAEPLAYRQQPSLSALQNADLPVVAIVVDGFNGSPTQSTRAARRAYTVTWSVSVGFWIRGDSWWETTAAGQRYAACVRAAVLTSPEGLAGRWVLTNEFYSDADETSGRTLAAGYVEFDVAVTDAVVPSRIGIPTPNEITSVVQTLTPNRPTTTGE